MTFVPAVLVPANPWLRAAAVIARAAAGLFVHGIVRPFAPAVMNARTGRVRDR